MRVRLAESVVFKEVGDELVLLDYAGGIYYGLDGVGARMWELLAAGHSDGEVLNFLVDEYDAPREQIAADLRRLITELHEQGLVIVD